MAGRDSWTSPVNALLDGAESTGAADADAPETEYGSPWARALRDIMERQTGVNVDDLRYAAPYQPAPPPFGQPPITTPQWPQTFGAELSPQQLILSSLLPPPGLAQAAAPTQKFAPLPPSGMPHSDVTIPPLIADGSGQFTPRPSSTTPAPVPVAYQDAERRWPGGDTLPSPWDPWYDQTIKGIQGLIRYFRSNRGASTPRGGGDDYCVNRWENEYDRCKYREEKWRSDCNRRAAIRLDQCVRYNGNPPNEPPEWSKADEKESFNPYR